MTDITKRDSNIPIGQTFDRNIMPQIENPVDFQKYLNDNDIATKKKLVHTDSLKASQLNFDNEKIEAMMSNPTNKMMIVSNDDHILDGHHRWLANKKIGRKCLVLKANLPILDLIKTAKDYNNQLNEEASFHDHGEMNHEKFGPMLDSFVQFASKKLGIKSLPSMKLEKEPMTNSFGGYNPENQSIVVISKNRHPMDIFRTVAHELVHHKQKEDGRIGKNIAKEGSTGSPQENEANAEAGKIMRWFAKSNPEMFKSGYVVESYLHEGLQDPGKFKVVFMAGGPGSGKDFVMKKALAGLDLIEINSDNAFEHLMKMRGLDMMMPKEEEYERDITRGIAKRVTKEKERLAIAGRNGIIINGTADDPEKIASIKMMLDDLGYESQMIFVNTNNEVSRERNFQRGLGGGRKVPDGTDKNGKPDGTPDIRLEKWEAAQEAKEILKKLFGKENYVEVDNSEDIRTVDDNRKKEINKIFSDLYKRFRTFVSTPAQTEKASEWIGAEMQKRQITSYTPARATSVSQRQQDKQDTPPNASEMEQAKRLGLTYYKFGRWGKTIEGRNVVTHISQNGQLVAKPHQLAEDLRTWFKQKWVRFDTKGNIKGDCAREPGEGKPKCRPLASAVAMGKEARAKSARRKRREDPVANRPGKGNKPINVKTESVQKAIDKINRDRMSEEVLLERNIPTNPKLWARAKALAKSKFDVYPSAYANGWASKWYKTKGGGWKTASKDAQVDEACWDTHKQVGMKKKGNRMVPNCVPIDEAFEDYIKMSSNREEASNSLVKIYKTMTPGQNLAQEDNTIPRGGIGNSGIGPETTVYRPMVASGYGGAGTIPMYESVINWMNNPKTQQRFFEKYGNKAEQKLYEAAERLNEIGSSNSGPKFFTHLREAWSYGKSPTDNMGTVSKQGMEEIPEENEDEALKKVNKITSWLKSGAQVDKETGKEIIKLPHVNDLPDSLKQFKIDEEKEDVIKPSKSLKGYKKHIHPMSTFEKKSLDEDEEQLNERGADSKGLYRSTESGAGLTRKGAKHFGVKTAVTTPPSKLKPGSKAAKRRKSFCARMGGMPGPMKDEKGRPTRKAMSLRRWNCEE